MGQALSILDYVNPFLCPALRDLILNTITNLEKSPFYKVLHQYEGFLSSNF